uniref:Putative ovule protein n=1 Tax=Solanum chacoense TaxID=4108 RepID=A0A0V0H575_SOLCH
MPWLRLVVNKIVEAGGASNIRVSHNLRYYTHSVIQQTYNVVSVVPSYSLIVCMTSSFLLSLHVWRSTLRDRLMSIGNVSNRFEQFNS